MIRIDELKLKVKRLKYEVELKRQELVEAESHLALQMWEPITWGELEALLKQKYAGRKYWENPMVSRWHGSVTSYCFITEYGELQVGPYFNNDQFPRGCDLYIRTDRKPWQ